MRNSLAQVRHGLHFKSLVRQCPGSFRQMAGKVGQIPSPEDLDWMSLEIFISVLQSFQYGSICLPVTVENVPKEGSQLMNLDRRWIIGLCNDRVRIFHVGIISRCLIRRIIIVPPGWWAMLVNFGNIEVATPVIGELSQSIHFGRHECDQQSHWRSTPADDADESRVGPLLSPSGIYLESCWDRFLWWWLQWNSEHGLGVDALWSGGAEGAKQVSSLPEAGWLDFVDRTEMAWGWKKTLLWSQRQMRLIDICGSRVGAPAWKFRVRRIWSARSLGVVPLRRLPSMRIRTMMATWKIHRHWWRGETGSYQITFCHIIAGAKFKKRGTEMGVVESGTRCADISSKLFSHGSMFLFGRAWWQLMRMIYGWDWEVKRRIRSFGNKTRPITPYSWPSVQWGRCSLRRSRSRSSSWRTKVSSVSSDHRRSIDDGRKCRSHVFQMCWLIM